MSKDIKEVVHICYTVSVQDLIQIWVETFHMNDHVVIIHDARNHMDMLNSLGFGLDNVKLFDNKILTIRVDCLEDCFVIADNMPIENNPYLQIFSLGKYITDNIET